MKKRKIAKIIMFGTLWSGSIAMCSNNIVDPTICLLIGIPCGCIFMKETRF